MVSTRVLPYGRNGLLVELATTAEVGPAVATLSSAFPAARVQAGWRSVLVALPPDVPPVTHDALMGKARRAMQDAATEGVVGSTTRVHHHHIAVTYDGDDLADLAPAVGLSNDEVVARHCAPTYEVVCIGFTRGFPYLAGLDPALHVPRRATPRTIVPAHSLAIAGEQCGIYPNDSPGGWHLLGQAHCVVFDPSRSPAALFAPGDTVAFHVSR